MTRCRWIT